MTEIVTSGSSSIADLRKRIGEYMTSPTRIAQASLDVFEEISNGQIDLVDAATPFTLLFEMSCTHAAMAVNEGLLNLRRDNVALAQTDDDVYRHLTDEEYLGRFATPGSVPFTIMIETTSLLKAMVYDPTEGCYKATLPRDTVITVDTYTFTFEYPVVFKRYPNNNLQVVYETTYLSPITTPSNNFIPFKVRKTEDGSSWLYFTLPVKQMAITPVYEAIQRNAVFSKSIDFQDQFLYARVFNKAGDSTGPWVELRTTHSDQVFDNAVPTAVLKVTTGNLKVTIPFIYNTLGLVGGQIRIDLYTTKGEVTVNLATYTAKAFSIRYRSIDEVRDNSVYSQVWGNVTLLQFSDQILTGGTDGIDFETLKQKITNYAFGKFNIPITSSQLDTLTETLGFTIVRNTDALTNRYFLGQRPIPEISVTDTKTNTQKLLSRANIGMIRLSSSIETLRASTNVIRNGDRCTLLSGTVFSLINGVAKLVDLDAINALKGQPSNALVAAVNDTSYVYTPYYYLYDTSTDTLDVRPYDLDHPDASDLVFVRQNNSLALAVNTGSYDIVKTPTGYRVTIVTLSGSAYKSLGDQAVSVQMRIKGISTAQGATINGTQVGLDANGERIYRFDLECGYDLDDQHNLSFINFYAGSVVAQDFYTPLTTQVDILYSTNPATPDFSADDTDLIINKETLPAGSVGNSHDQITLFFGSFLEHLWARFRNYASEKIYQTSPVDVQATYQFDVYETNPQTGSMLFFDGPNGSPNKHKIHSQGDPIVDNQGQPVYKYRKGSPIYDQQGNPVEITQIASNNDFDILVIDGKLSFVTDPIYLDYRNQVVKLMTQWITQDILEVQKRLIERTEIFFYPQASLGDTKIILDQGSTAYIASEQRPVVTIYVEESVLSDQSVLNNMTQTTNRYLDTRLRATKYTINTIETEIRQLLGNVVLGVSISNIGGASDYKAISVSDEHNRLCVKRKLVAQTDGSLILDYDTNILFKAL